MYQLLQMVEHNFGMRLFYLQLRSFYLQFVFFTYSGGAASKKEQTDFQTGGNPKQKKPTQFPDGGNGNSKRPSRFSTVSNKDQTKLPQATKTNRK